MENFLNLMVFLTMWTHHELILICELTRGLGPGSIKTRVDSPTISKDKVATKTRV